MQKSQRKVWMIVTGALFLAISIGLFTWYNTEVLTPEEVQGLESGGSGGDTAFESFAAFGSPPAPDHTFKADSIPLQSTWSGNLYHQPDIAVAVFEFHVHVA